MIIQAGQMPGSVGGGGNTAAFASPSALLLAQIMSNNQGILNFQQNLMSGQFNPTDMAQPKVVEGNNVVLRYEGDSSDNHEEEEANPRRKRKRYHRHTQHQIQELEAFFKECPHPDDKQRKKLSQELGLGPLQVKFWFQNKRTQVKMQQERYENQQLRSENEKLRAENMRFRETINRAICSTCGSPVAMGEISIHEHELQIENNRLRGEIERILGFEQKPWKMGYEGKHFPNSGTRHSNQNLTVSPPITPPTLEGEILGAEELLSSIPAPPASEEKQRIVELAVAAVDELARLAETCEPLWFPSFDGSTYFLDEEEYFRVFPRGIGPRPPMFRSEASHHSAVVIMNANNLVDILMDADQWSAFFSDIVTSATILEILSTGAAGSHNGTLQVMTASLQVLSPLVPTRDIYFARYCKLMNESTWAVVDVSLDGLQPGPSSVCCRRRPSGCLIEEMPNGYSKITWVEHVEVEEKGVRNIYTPLVNSGLAFGAKRWIASINRQCERLAIAMAANHLGPRDVPNAEGRNGMLKLAERMVRSFCVGVSPPPVHSWTALSGSGADDVRVMTQKSVDDPGRPPGIVINAATAFWLPVPPKAVFDFLRNDQFRSEWDILSNGGAVQEMASINTGREPGHCVSLLRVDALQGSSNNMLVIQEAYNGPTGAFLIYAPVDFNAIGLVLNGGDPDYVALLPSGFSILPDGQTDGDAPSGGSLVTIAFQILVDSLPTARLSLGSVATCNNLISCTVERLKTLLGSGNA
ncbi:hypothetical protein NMG60_11035457 [Bertholletia excelsa]